MEVNEKKNRERERRNRTKDNWIIWTMLQQTKQMEKEEEIEEEKPAVRWKLWVNKSERGWKSGIVKTWQEDLNNNVKWIFIGKRKQRKRLE